VSFWLIFGKFIPIPKLSYMKGLLILTLLSCFSYLVYGQKTLSGKVTDRSSGGVLVGASIKVKGTKRGVSTGSDGGFALPVNPGDV
jgi:iron complex outermembrane receptor protein